MQMRINSGGRVIGFNSAISRLVLLACILPGGIESVDQNVRGWVQSHRRPYLEPLMHAATGLWNRGNISGVLLGIAVLDGAAGVATVRLAITSLVATNVVVEGLKRGTNRARPDGEHNRSNSSFPSGHAASAVTLAVVFARRWKRVALAIWLAAILVACSRVYLDRHYLSDVLVAAAIGAAGASLMIQWPPASSWRFMRSIAQER